MKITPYHPFRSAKAKQRYLSRYDQRAEALPVAQATQNVETSYGQTFVRLSGPETGAPLVLLPSAGGNSLLWRPNIEALSAVHRVIAVDHIYDFGRSVYTRPMKTLDDNLTWLTELLDALELKENLNLMGLSFGAWLSVQFAILNPGRLAKLIFIAPPATFFQFPGKWAWYGLTSLLPHRYFLMNMTRWMMKDLTENEDEASKQLVNDLVDDAFLALRCYKLKMPVTPTVLCDEELARIPTPSLFMVGENEVIYPAEKAIERLAQANPKVQTVLIPNAGHDLTMVQADLVNREVLAFLK